MQGLRIQIRGIVQGVGFRPWIYRLAREEGIAGRVRNDTAGVTIDAFGAEPSIEAFLGRVRSDAPPSAAICDIETAPIAVEALDEFSIVESDAAGAPTVAIPPDLATCPACVAEIFDPRDRRYGYPFTNCTNCGPRFTIARDVPYDRSRTTMAVFEMCPRCRREYESPDDRRFHAQPNACPACGPSLVAMTPEGRPLDVADPVAEAAWYVARGLIVALKGIGGFHLACDATSESTVARLRARKRRQQKPFAVMVRDVSAAFEVAHLTTEELALLVSAARPIVLVRRRETAPLADAVAPRNPLVGLLLPYSPLHHLLLDAAKRPLVMTSGNLSEEPLAYRNAEALERLGGIADLFLAHDREIETPCDDSVGRVIAGRPVVLRRARGYVPRPLKTACHFRQPVLACGALLKNTFCLGTGDLLHPGPHIGDLENLDTYRAYEEAIDRLQRFLQIEPEIIAHDLHPHYLSTSYALARPETMKVAVQHHHAHVVSCMTEHGLTGPVLGLAYDGTGYGLDGTAWGGELLLANLRSFHRLATFRPVRLPGGDTAIRQPWRIALALLDDAFAGTPPRPVLPLFHAVSATDVTAVTTLLRSTFNVPSAHGVGRFFDAIGALVLERPLSSYEGQIALEWNLAADPVETTSYPFTLNHDAEPWHIDLRPMVRAIVADVGGGWSPATISARFHNTLIEATATLVRAAARRHSGLPVVLSGGCFQNARLTEGLLGALAPEFAVYRHEAVPPGDGGVAVGQAVIASAIVDGIQPDTTN